MNYGALICLIFTAAATEAQAASERLTTETPAIREVAERSLAVLKKQIKPDNFERSGFLSAEESRTATLGNPIRVLFVRLDELRDFSSGKDVKALLHDLGELIYPVVVNREVRTSITLGEKEGRWRFTRFGPSRLAIALLGDNRAQVEALAVSPTDVSVVRVAALGTYFLGHQTGGGMVLTPIVNDPAAKLVRGRPRPADEVLLDLVPFAVQHNGLPH
jgi:hypothetical protein